MYVNVCIHFKNVHMYVVCMYSMFKMNKYMYDELVDFPMIFVDIRYFRSPLVVVVLVLVAVVVVVAVLVVCTHSPSFCC